MSEVEKTHQNCIPKDQGGCEGSGCVTVFKNGSSFCHQCPPEKAFRPNKTPKGTEAPVIRKYELDKDIDWSFTDHRGITAETNEKLGITTGSKNGKPVVRVYPYPHDTKARWLPKDMKDNKGFSNDHLAGMNLFNAGSSQKITITEGEEDWASLYQVLGYKYPVVNIPGASSPQKILQNKAVYDYLSSFKQIILCTDSDKAGNEAANTFVRAFPGKCKRVNMSKYKDPNAYIWDNDKGLPRDDGSELFYAWLNATPYKPDNVSSTPEEFVTILREEKSSMYLPTNIQDLDAKVRGLMQGRFTVFQAPEGIGKTEFMRYLEYNLIKNHPTVPIAIMHMEETRKRSLLGLASYHLMADVTQQDTETQVNEEGEEETVFLPTYNGVPEEDVERAIREISARENLYQFTLGVDEDPTSILDQIRYFSEVYGVRYVFFEPIQDLAASRTDDGTTEQFLTNLSTKMARLCSEMNVGVVTIAHENDDGAIRDCRMIGKRADVVIKLSRDKMAADDAMRNTTQLTVVKNRPSSTTGPAGQLYFDENTFTLSERM